MKFPDGKRLRLGWIVPLLPGPLADWFFTKRLTDETAGFVSDQIIGQVSVPILFLHAKVNTSTI